MNLVKWLNSVILFSKFNTLTLAHRGIIIFFFQKHIVLDLELLCVETGTVCV